MYNKISFVGDYQHERLRGAFLLVWDMTLDVDLEFLTFHFRSPAVVEGD
jgi:hypothetical protein